VLWCVVIRAEPIKYLSDTFLIFADILTFMQTVHTRFDGYGYLTAQGFRKVRKVREEILA
jgi:hypothetical protein